MLANGIYAYSVNVVVYTAKSLQCNANIDVVVCQYGLTKSFGAFFMSTFFNLLNEVISRLASFMGYLNGCRPLSAGGGKIFAHIDPIPVTLLNTIDSCKTHHPVSQLLFYFDRQNDSSGIVPG